MASRLFYVIKIQMLIDWFKNDMEGKITLKYTMCL